jgi:hypothetical protein
MSTVNRRKNILETPKRRRRKRRLYIRKAIVYVILIGIIIFGIVSFFRLSYFQISSVSVTGNNKLDGSMIVQEAQADSSGYYYFIIPKKFFLFYPKKEITTHLQEKYKDIDKVSVSTEGLNDAHIVITERVPFAVYCNSQCFFMDRNGYVFSTDDQTNDSNLVTFQDMRPEYASSSIGIFPLKTSVFAGVESFTSELSGLGLHFEKVVIGVNSDVTISNDEGDLYISLNQSLTDQLALLQTALTQSIFKNADGSIKSFGYIDLRFNNKIFYTMTPLHATSSATSTDSSNATSTATTTTPL